MSFYVKCNFSWGLPFKTFAIKFVVWFVSSKCMKCVLHFTGSHGMPFERYPHVLKKTRYTIVRTLRAQLPNDLCSHYFSCVILIFIIWQRMCTICCICFFCIDLRATTKKKTKTDNRTIQKHIFAMKFTHKHAHKYKSHKIQNISFHRQVEIKLQHTNEFPTIMN